MKKRRISKIQIFRAMIQLGSFVFISGLFTILFGSIKSIYLNVISQNFSLQENIAQIILIAGVLLLTMLTGRFFCGWMCSFGALMDLLHYLSTKLMKKKLVMSETFEGFLKSFKYIILAFTIVVIWTMGKSVFAQDNPWNVFGMLSSFSNLSSVPSFLFEMKIGAILLGFIIVGGFFIERFFCRYLCPMGAVFAVFSKTRMLKLKKQEHDCGKCMGCTKACSMGINLNKVNQVDCGECINCLKCMDGCNRTNLSFTIGKIRMNRTVAALMTVVVIMGTTAAYEVSNYIDYQTASSISATITKNNTAYAAQSSEATSNSAIASSGTGTSSVSGTLKDGVYEGSGSGFKGTTTVQVTVENGSITNVQTVSTGDDKPYYNRAFSSVVQQIVSTQNASVDAVSGATFSSNGIMEAVANAIGQDYQNNNSQLQRGHRHGGQ